VSTRGGLRYTRHVVAPSTPYFTNPPAPPPPRSAIPRVIGILATIFSVFGGLFMAVWTFGPLSDLSKHHLLEQMSNLVSWFYACAALSVVVFGLHLSGGIMAIVYKFTGLRLLTLYAVLAILLVIADVILVLVLMPDHIEGRAGLTLDIRFSVTTMRIVFDALALPWPVVVLALANNPRARAACT
jgi:hypothetical protein